MDAINNTSNPTAWNKSYMLDISLIDNQHAHFFMLFDKILELNKKDNSFSELEEIIVELEKYTQLHFQTEEALMRKANFPEYESHLLQHTIFSDKIKEFKIEYTYKNSVLLEQMILFMRKWFLIHIAETDKKYSESVKKYLADKDYYKNEETTQKS